MAKNKLSYAYLRDLFVQYRDNPSEGDPIIKPSTHNHNKKSNKNYRKMAKQSRKINRRK